ncbi:MAG: ParB/RepB/Spo0J family partition protein [Fibrobacteres bacterium]|nr:ParB/RepB/Spo0J family partition protein [Fibrobacterota bacterium]
MTDKKKRLALHRGLKALISEEAVEMHETERSPLPPQSQTVSRETGGYFTLPVSEIEANPYQPREEFNEEDLKELKDSIAKHGVLEPVIVRKSKGRYELVSGERRLRAVRALNMQDIPAVIRDKVSDREMQILALVENQMRSDLNDYEIALGYQELVAQYNYTHEKLAEDTGKSRSFVSNTLRLLKLPDDVKTALREKKISSGHARALLASGDETAQTKLLNKIITEDLNVRQVEKLVSESKAPSDKKKESIDIDPDMMELIDRLTKLFGTKIEIQNSNKDKGKLVIHYTDTADLNRITDFFVSPEKVED